MNVLIIGATQGLGQALAEHYLAAGHQVCICGRDLEKVQRWRYFEHPQLSQFALDVNDSAQLSELFSIYQQRNLDLLINCAGIYVNNRDKQLDESQTQALLNTNVVALTQILSLASHKMLQQGHGHIVALSSVAALINYPGASLYSASKRSVINLCETYRIALADFGISVTTIVPGYINTSQLRALNNGDASHKLFIIEPEEAVKLIVKGISLKKALVVFPRRMHWLMLGLSMLPRWLLQFFLAKRDAKSATLEE